MKPTFNISCSTIKGWNQVDMGEMCGLYFKAAYIDKTIPFQSRPAFVIGQWAEYMMTGVTPRDGAPEPVYLKDGKTLNTQFQRLKNQAGIWKEYCKRKGIENYKTGRTIEFEFNGYTIKGVLDVDYMNGDRFTIIDIKTSGYLDNKWESNGWKDIENKKLLTIQAPGYIWLVHKALGIPIDKIDFYFYVIHSNHDYERKIFKIICTEASLKWFESEINYISKSIEHNELLGWPSTQKFEHCVECELRANCSRRLYDPEPLNVYHI